MSSTAVIAGKWLTLAHLVGSVFSTVIILQMMHCLTPAAMANSMKDPSAMSAELQTSDAAALFAQVFGSSAPTAAQRFDAPVLFDGRVVATVLVELKGKTTRIAFAPLTGALEPAVARRALDRLQALSDPEGLIDISQTAGSEIELTFNPATLEIIVLVASEFRRERVVSLSGRLPATLISDVSRRGRVSGFLNARPRLGYSETRFGGVRTIGMKPATSDFSGAFAVSNHVLEYAFSYDSVTPWSRGPIRFVTDAEDSSSRIAVGDIVSSSRGFQAADTLGGIIWSREFSIRPYERISPAGFVELVLERPTRVDIAINGQPSSSLDIGPGPVVLRDFPLFAGANEVIINLRDDRGRERQIIFDQPFSSALLATGRDDFAIAIGAPRRDGDRIRYIGTEALFSGYYRRGLSPTTTVGGNLQITGRQALLGIESTVATSLGNGDFDIGLSSGSAGVEPGVALAFSYDYNEAGTAITPGRIWFATARAFSPNFAAPGDEPLDTNFSLDFAGRVIQPINAQTSMALGFTHQQNSGASHGDTSFDLAAQYRIGPNLGLTGRLRYDRRSTGDNGDAPLSAGLFLTYSFDDGRQSVRSQMESRDRMTRIEWQRNPESQVGGAAVQAAAQTSLEGAELGSRVTWITDRFDVAFEHTHSRRVGDVRNTSSEGGLNFGIAVAFVDGHAAVGRPISDGFAIVKPHPQFGGQKILINPDGDSALAQIDILGNALLPSLTPYEVSKISIDAPDLPIGYDIGDTNPRANVSFKGGALLQVGTGARLIIDGYLVNADGKPISLKAGKILPAGGNVSDATQFFTNRQGRFRVSGLQPGTFNLSLNQSPDQIVSVPVAEESEGIVNVGIIQY